MPSATEIIGVLIREMSPVLVEAYKIERSRGNISKLEAINKEYLQNATVVNMAEGLKVRVANCPACAAKMDQARGKKPVLELKHEHDHDINHGPAVPVFQEPTQEARHTTEDHLHYTDEQIIKQLVLLEEHFKSYQCGECIEKHLLGLEGYAEEGMGMNGPEPYGSVQSWAKQARERKDYPNLYREARELRRKVQPHSHEEVPVAKPQQSDWNRIIAR
jgi:hypothetical protein